MLEVEHETFSQLIFPMQKHKISVQKDRKYTKSYPGYGKRNEIVLARSSSLALRAARSSLHNPIGDGMNEIEVTVYRIN
ncbi:hypothetical protein GJ496_003381 [Pomphorhynchus laevis]|nr:hypothetical protein GJ496_003381 [Pomphorhynchus laevis]